MDCADVDREIVQLESTMVPHRSHRSILGQTISLTMALQKGCMDHIWVLLYPQHNADANKPSVSTFRQRDFVQSTEIKT